MIERYNIHLLAWDTASLLAYIEIHFPLRLDTGAILHNPHRTMLDLIKNPTDILALNPHANKLNTAHKKHTHDDSSVSWDRPKPVRSKELPEYPLEQSKYYPGK